MTIKMKRVKAESYVFYQTEKDGEELSSWLGNQNHLIFDEEAGYAYICDVGYDEEDLELMIETCQFALKRLKELNEKKETIPLKQKGFEIMQGEL